MPQQQQQNRGITLLTKVHLVKAMVFPVVMYGCEIWTVKKAECQRIDAFELWCWRRFFFFCMYFFFVSYMILYMFQCHSPKSSHPHSLPQNPKDCSIHLCLFCCLAYRVIVTFFLNSIYMHQYTVLVFFFLAYFTLYNRLQFHPPHQN